jgi:hypothetical protein
MVTQIIHDIKRWFNQCAFCSELDRYITSHKPQSVAEVERLTEEFERRYFLQGKIKL